MISLYDKDLSKTGKEFLKNYYLKEGWPGKKWETNMNSHLINCITLVINGDMATSPGQSMQVLWSSNYSLSYSPSRMQAHVHFLPQTYKEEFVISNLEITKEIYLCIGYFGFPKRSREIHLYREPI